MLGIGYHIRVKSATARRRGDAVTKTQMTQSDCLKEENTTSSTKRRGYGGSSQPLHTLFYTPPYHTTVRALARDQQHVLEHTKQIVRIQIAPNAILTIIVPPAAMVLESRHLG